jgi:hypothetical protein
VDGNRLTFPIRLLWT